MNTAAAVQSFIYNRRALNRRPNTIKWYEKNLMRLIEFAPELPMEPEPLEQFLSEVISDGKEQTRHGYFRALKALYRFTCRRRRLLNPMDLIDPPALHDKVKASLSAHELMNLLSKPPGIRDTALLTLFVDSGCRAGEAVSLRKQHIYDDYVIVDGKRGQRFCFITEETHRLLLNLVTSNDSSSDYVFLGQRGPLTTSGVYRIVSKYLKASNVPAPKMGPHRLRHAFGKNYILNGGDTRSLQEIMGHRNISVTEEYVELSQKEVRGKHHQFTPLRSAHAAAQGSFFNDETNSQALQEAEKILTDNS
jgi:site-specific recombinase XerD